MQQPNAMNVKWILAAIEHYKIVSERVFEGGKKKASKSSIRYLNLAFLLIVKDFIHFLVIRTHPKQKAV
jgi:hypothetical protein